MINVASDLSIAMAKLDNLGDKIRFIVTEQIIKDSNFYIPKDKGDLEDSVFIHSRPREGHIEWNTPYARRLYWNPQYNFSKDANPNARGKWFEYAKSEHLHEWVQLAQTRWDK